MIEIIATISFVGIVSFSVYALATATKAALHPSEKRYRF